MRLLDLFSGIGGFSYAAQQVWKNELEIVGFVEIDKFCQKVLRKHWPNVPIYEDIKELDGTQFKSIDLITGGFPCQPFSVAGKRQGEKDDRFLWPEMLRIIQETKSRWVIGENVTGILHMEFDKMLSSLENSGYEVETLIIPACGVNASHRRDRVWIVAFSESDRDCRRSEPICETDGRSTRGLYAEPCNSSDVANSMQFRGRRRNNGNEGELCGTLQVEGSSAGNKPELLANTNDTGRTCRWTDTRMGMFKTNERKIGKANWEKPIEWAVEPNVGRVAHGIPSRVDRLKSLGNAIVPQVTQVIMQAIKEIDDIWSG